MSNDKILTTEEAAEEFEIPVGTLIKARIKGNGPRFLKLGDANNAPLRYRASDIEDWLDSNTYTSVAEAMNQK